MKIETDFEIDQRVTHKRLPIHGIVQGASRWRHNTIRIAVDYTDANGTMKTEWLDVEELAVAIDQR